MCGMFRISIYLRLVPGWLMEEGDAGDAIDS